ncbi:MAG: RluA family pseudouridine synthase [Prevotella sp.]|nr:RluA family pseudouridine synthase [Prevotella sp.]
MPTSILHPLNTLRPWPTEMNDPFFYEPHPVCVEAIEQAMPMIQSLMQDETEGKMFGVLIVEKDSQLYYLIAYSGQIGSKSDWPGFVPAVFDYLQPDGHFKRYEAKITAINHEVERLESQAERLSALKALELAESEATTELDSMRQVNNEARERRKNIRENGTINNEMEAELIRESQFQKAELRRRKKFHTARIEELKAISETYEQPIRVLKVERRKRSDELQNWLFEQFVMLNYEGKKRDLIDIFKETSLKIPPAGAGECCEPKLLQYAFQNGLKPLQMAMFWIGPSPKVEIRHNGQFYPACRGKCLPILRWMLGVKNVDKGLGGGNSTHNENAHSDAKKETELLIIYEDETLVVVNKPAGLLSAPGISEHYSVWSIMRRRYPDTDSPLIAHRLDQPTSGLLLVAKTRKAHRELQRQFMNHEIKKRYVALLEHSIDEEIYENTSSENGIDISANSELISENKGNATPKCIRKLLKTIELPLYADPLNRPYQSVDEEHGKVAVTQVEFLGNSNGHARVALYPQTGRTHQLRVHCAHERGLDNPILGDQLYGSKQAPRLYLHAESITFRHPETGELMQLSAPADF